LIKGDDVLTRISATPVAPSSSGEPSKPLKRIGVISITIAPADPKK
jgi:hypothetical protein